MKDPGAGASGVGWKRGTGDPREAALRAAYVEARRATVKLRLRSSAWIVVMIVAAVSPLMLLGASEDRVWIIGHSVFSLVVSVAALLGTRARVPDRFALPLGLAYGMALGGSLLWGGALSGEEPTLLAGAVGSVMIAGALLVPWGVGAQIVLTSSLGGLFALLPHGPGSPGPLVESLGILVAYAVLSIAGAALFDRHRYHAFREGEHARALSRSQEFLVAAGRRLAQIFEEDDLPMEIVGLARDLVGCDQASLTLLSNDNATSRVVAIQAQEPLRIREMLNVDVPCPPEFLAELAKQTVAEVPGEVPLFNEGTYPVMRRFGVGRSLFVVLRDGDRLLGYLNLDNVAVDPPFSREQRRAAEGLAYQAVIALRNKRLVGDLRTANRVRTDFVSMMSHELRTPLHVIVGFAEVLDDAVGERDLAAAGSAIERIRRASAALLALIEATLELNRLDSGHDEPILEPVALRGLFATTAAAIEAVAAMKGPSVVLLWLPGADAVVRTDPRKLEIVLRNLVGNALKFTPEGRVTVAYELDDDWLTVTVRDTGIGIPPDRQSLIFEMFQQGQGGDDRPYGGVGLGLYIVRRLVEQLGGEVDVASQPGQGSTFTVVIPAERLPKADVGGLAGGRRPSP